MAQIRVRRTASKEIFLHERLEEVCLIADRRFDTLTTPEAQPGWFAEALVGLVMTALLNEAIVNAVGCKIDRGWKERRNAEDKINDLANRFFGGRPELLPILASVHQVRDIRNDFAHAKPLLVQKTVSEVTFDPEIDDLDPDLLHEAERAISVEGYRRLREHSCIFRQKLVEAANLTRWDLKTKSSVHDTYIGPAEND